MGAVLFRLVLLATGLGVTEIGLARGLVVGSPQDWMLVLIGLALTVAGSAGFMVTILGGGTRRGPSTDV